MPFLISGGDRLDHFFFFFNDDCGLSATAAAPDLGADSGAAAAVSPDDDNAETGSVIEDSVEAAGVMEAMDIRCHEGDSYNSFICVSCFQFLFFSKGIPNKISGFLEAPLSFFCVHVHTNNNFTLKTLNVLLPSIPEPRGEHPGSAPPSSMLLRLPLGDTLGVPFGVAWMI